MASVTLQCEACGADNGAQAAFCQQCGRALSSTASSGGAQTRLLPNDILLNDRYRIMDRAGTGGFGAVYKAADTRFGDRPVAIKEMGQRGLSAQELAEAVEGFKHEALLLAGLNHPHLPRIYDHFSDGGRWYLMMDYIEGETLESYLERAPVDPASGHRHLSIEETLAIGMQLCTVLDYLHTRRPPIIFRDLKPANVMRSTDGHLYLIDFGIARHFKPGQIKDTMPLGSPGYAAPEQYGKGQTTPRADIYSLGVMLHQFISGENPAQTPFRLAPLRLSGHPALRRLKTLILQMIDMDEQRRPVSAAVVKEELGQIAGQLNNHERVLYAHNERRDGSIHHVPTDSGDDDDGEQAGGGQRMAPPIQRERPSRRGPSRRSFIVGGLASLLTLAGAATYAGLYKSGSTTSTTTTIKRVTPTLTAVASGGNVTLYHGHKDAVYSAAWSPDGRSIVSSSADLTVQIWDASSGKSRFTYRHPGPIDRFLNTYQALWTADGQQIISGDTINVQQWQASDGKHIYTYNDHPNLPSHDMALSPNGAYLALATYADAGKSTVQIWDVKNHQLINIYNTAYVYSLCWSPDSKKLALGTAGIVSIWDLTTGDISARLNNQATVPNQIAWSPDGRRLLYLGSNGRIYAWDMISEKPIAQQDHLTQVSNIYSLAWSPDGKYIATGHTTGQISIWLASNGELLTTHSGQSSRITTVGWSPDGKAIVSSSLDHTVLVWFPPGL